MQANPNRTRPAVRRVATGGAALLAIVLLLAGSFRAAFANVELTSFTATAQADNTILLRWETASEVDTVSFLLYRSQSAAPTSWGEPIHTTPAQGALAGAVYTYPDAAVEPGVLYYYRLEDLDNTGASSPHGPISAGIGVTTATPTNTPIRTATPTATNQPGAATATSAPPTATRRFTNTPPAPATPIPGAVTPGGTVPRSPIATPTRSGAAVITTPTRIGGAVIPPTLPPPTVAPAATVAPPTVAPQPTATVAIVALATATLAGPSPTPLIRTDATPVIFEAAPTRPGDENVSAGRATGPVLAIAGAALALSALIGAVVFFFLRARR